MAVGGGAVVARGIRKVYPNSTVALDNLNLDVPRGVIYSLLGRNGAGKTTFLKIASTQLAPTAGTVEVLGFDVMREVREIRSRIAVVPQEGRPASLNTPYEHILHYLIARGMSIREAKMRTKETLETLELNEHANTICSNLSGGLRQRTLVAMALSTDAELLFLDEPTIGLDAVTRLRIWDAVRNLTRKEGRTVLLTTHYMEEAESLSDRVAIMHQGRIVANGTVKEIKNSLDASVKVEVTGAGLRAADFEEYGRVVNLGDTFRIFLNNSAAREVVDLAISKGARATVSHVTLEDVFVALVGERLES